MRRIYSLAILGSLMAISACTHSEPGIEVRTVEVPTPVPCVDFEDVPAEPDQVGDQLTGDAAHDLFIIAPSALELRRWGRELRALIVPGCTRLNAESRRADP